MALVSFLHFMMLSPCCLSTGVGRIACIDNAEIDIRKQTAYVTAMSLFLTSKRARFVRQELRAWTQRMGGLEHNILTSDLNGSVR